MKIKYVCHGLISVHVNFHDNRTKCTLISNIKISRWGGKEKEPKKPVFVTTQELFLLFRISLAVKKVNCPYYCLSDCFANSSITAWTSFII